VPCPFCQLDPSHLVWSSPLVLAVRDAFPVSRGHTLVIPRRHVPTWFNASPQEQREIWRAIAEIKSALDRDLHPDGYNIGINVGQAAGQTIDHLHVHLVPRFHDDVDDPAGGVRFVIPAYGNYRAPGTVPRPTGTPPAWLRAPADSHRLATGGTGDPFAHHLRPVLARARLADIVAAFVQGSGIDILESAITTALDRGTRFRVLTGDYLHITQSQALRRLLDWSQLAASAEEPAGGTFAVRVVETAAIEGRSFHPKSWRVETDTEGVAWVGSSNWSWMALQQGIEWNLRVNRAADPRAYDEITHAFEVLCAPATPLTAAWLEDYAKRAKNWDHPLPLGDGEDIQPAQLYVPRGVQPEALAALE